MPQCKCNMRQRVFRLGKRSGRNKKSPVLDGLPDWRRLGGQTRRNGARRTFLKEEGIAGLHFFVSPQTKPREFLFFCRKTSEIARCVKKFSSRPRRSIPPRTVPRSTASCQKGLNMMVGIPQGLQGFGNRILPEGVGGGICVKMAPQQLVAVERRAVGEKVAERAAAGRSSV